MEKNNLKNIFRQELEDHKVFIDKDDLWAGIQKKKKKRVGLFFWFGLASFAVILGLGLWNTFGDFSSDSDNIEIAPSSLKEEALKINKNIAEFNDRLKERNTPMDIPIGVVKTNEKDLGSKNENSKIRNQIIVVDQDIIRSEAKNVATTPSSFEVPSLVQNKKSNTAKKSIDYTVKKDIVLIEKEPLIVEAEIILDQTNTPVQDTEVMEEEIIANAIDENIESKTNLLPDDLNENTETNINLIPNELDEEESANITIESPIKPFRFEVIPQFEYGIPIKTLAARNEMENDLSVLRNQVETPLENWSVGLVLQANHKSGLFLSGGFRFDQLQEKVEFSEVIQDPILLDDVILEEVTFEDGSVSNARGEAMGTRVSTNVFNVYNTYRKFSVPLSIGYEKKWKNWAVDGGINFIFNLKHTFNGYILDFDTADENYFLVKDADIFKGRLDMDMRLNIGVTYKFSKWKIRLSPFVQLNESQILNIDSELNQGYKYYGVNLGLRL